MTTTKMTTNYYLEDALDAVQEAHRRQGRAIQSLNELLHGRHTIEDLKPEAVQAAITEVKATLTETGTAACAEIAKALIAERRPRPDTTEA